MSDIVPAGQSLFDSIRHEDEQGEYWLARELQPLLEYERWQDFDGAIQRAIEDCVKSGRDVKEHFQVFRRSPKNSSGGRPPKDYRLTRYACRLITMQSRTEGKTASQARTYFSDKVDQAERDDVDVIEDDGAGIEEWKERAIRAYMAHGFSLAYAKNRVDGILVRKAITSKWVLIGITDEEIAILTDQMHMGTFDISVDTHKALKGFPEVRVGRIIRHKGNLRPALTPMEQAVITFAENVTLALHEERDSHGFIEASRDVDDGAALAKENRLRLEQLTGKPVVSSRNMLKSPDGGIFGDLDAPDDD